MFSIYQKIPENSGNFGGKCLSVKDVFHLTHVPFIPRLPSPCNVFPAKIQNGGTTVVVEGNAGLLFGRRVSLIQMIMAFVTWQWLQPMRHDLHRNKVFMILGRSMNLKATLG